MAQLAQLESARLPPHWQSAFPQPRSESSSPNITGIAAALGGFYAHIGGWGNADCLVVLWIPEIYASGHRLYPLRETATKVPIPNAPQLAMQGVPLGLVKKTVRTSVPHLRSRAPEQAISAILVCFLFTACVGWGNFKMPAYVVNGTIGGVGAITVLSATQDTGDNGGVGGAVIGLGIVLIAAATLGALITSGLPGPKKIPGSAQAWPE